MAETNPNRGYGDTPENVVANAHWRDGDDLEPAYRTMMRERGIPSSLTDEEIMALNANDYQMSLSNQRGVGGKGWRGDKTWRDYVNIIGKGGSIEALNGQIPTKLEAIYLINEAGGVVLRIEEPHQPPNPHNYNHINYMTSNGEKGTVQIQ